MNKGIWVFVEQTKSELKEASLMLISEAQKLADRLEEELSAVLFGHDVAETVEKVAHYGAEKVFVAENDLLGQYSAELYTSVLVTLIHDYQPSILLFTATSIGRDLAPKIATELKTGLVCNCNGLEIDNEDQLVMIKPIYGGKLWLKAICPNKRPQIATVLPDALDKEDLNESRVAEIIKIKPEISSKQMHTNVTGFIKGDPKTIDITDAELIVCAGGGLGDSKNLKYVEELADVLGASIGGSRVAVDNKWISFSRQVGQTGKTVSPKLIMIFGISGAIQFTMGMKDSKLIIANNKDRSAPIFKVADVGIVGDLKEVIPALADRLAEATKSEE